MLGAVYTCTKTYLTKASEEIQTLKIYSLMLLICILRYPLLALLLHLD